MFSEIDFTKQVFERLYSSNNAQIPKEELERDLTRLIEVLDLIRQVNNIGEKSRIYYSDYRSLSNELKTKYKEFLPDNAFAQIEYRERYMDTLERLMRFMFLMLDAFEKEPDPTIQAHKLYSGMIRISELLERELPYFSSDWVSLIENVALALLNDQNLQPNEANQPPQLFGYLITLKQACRAVLWLIDKVKTEKDNSNWIARIRRIRESGYAKEPGKISYEDLLAQWQQKYSEKEMEESAEYLRRVFNRDNPA